MYGISSSIQHGLLEHNCNALILSLGFSDVAPNVGVLGVLGKRNWIVAMEETNTNEATVL